MIADLYIRVSTEEQSFGYSPRYQEDTLRTYCQAFQIEVGMVIIEDYSAKTFNRPAWNKLYLLYKSRRLPTPRILLITKWDRFSRNTGDAYFMISQLDRLHVDVRAVEQPIDLSVPETKVMMAIFLAIPEVENERRGLNIKQGIKRAKQEGRHIGPAPVGYINKITAEGHKSIEPHEPYCTIMRFAFQEVEKGILSTSEVFRLVIRMGFDKSENCFREALRNPVYCGKVVAWGEDNKSRILLDGNHKSIVSEALFMKVQKILARKRVMPRSTRCDTRLPLRGMLLCPGCSRTLTGSGSSGRNKVYYYYHCLSSCGKRFATRIVEEEFLSLLKHLVPTTYFEKKYEEVFNGVFSKELKIDLDRQTKLQSQIDGLNQRLVKAKDLLLTDGIDVGEYKQLRDSCLIKIELLETSILDVVRGINEKTSALVQKRYYFSHLDQLYTVLDVAKKRELSFTLFPFGITYGPSCFCISQIAESLRVVYSELPHVLSSDLDPADNCPTDFEAVDCVQDSPLVRKVIKSIINELGNVPLKQAIEIVNYFKTIVRLSIETLFTTEIEVSASN